MITAINAILNQYIQTVSTTYNIPAHDLQDIMDKVPVTADVKPLLPPVQPPPTTTTTTCSYVYVKGQKSGTSCSNKRKKDSEFCSQHSKKKETAPVEAPQIVVVETAKEAPKKPNPVLRMNKIINKWWHPETGLVFKSSEEKIVIGIFKDESIHDLTEDDVATCVTYKFKYVFNKRKKEEDEEEDEEVTPPKVKKQKTIDTAFIKINQEAKNVEVLIKEMFNKNVEDDDDDDVEEVAPTYDDGDGAQESKTCYHPADDDDDEELPEEEAEHYEEELLEEED
jgi:hypothetical protein